MESLKRSLREFGAVDPAIVNSDGTIIGGHQRVEAARQLEWSEFPVIEVDLSEERARLLNLALNRISGQWDEVLLAELLAELATDEADLALSGFEETEIEALIGEVKTREGEDTPPPEPPEDPRSSPGDLWLLGEHRVLCGDSTDPDHVRRLLDDVKADLLYTDPPYGMSYKSTKHEVIEGDRLRGSELEQLVSDALSLARASCTKKAAAFIWATWRTYPEFVSALREASLDPTACIVWNKGRIGPGAMHYRPQHEFCIYCRPLEDNDHELCIYCQGEDWSGPKGESDVWTISRDQGYDHPTQKPTALGERAIKATTRQGDLVLDPFGGSGSTLLAADNLKRRAALMELDPRYVDVIVRRWETHTGGKAELARTEADS
jgi:DNA modification methylase